MFPSPSAGPLKRFFSQEKRNRFRLKRLLNLSTERHAPEFYGPVTPSPDLSALVRRPRLAFVPSPDLTF